MKKKGLAWFSCSHVCKRVTDSFFVWIDLVYNAIMWKCVCRQLVINKSELTKYGIFLFYKEREVKLDNYLCRGENILCNCESYVKACIDFGASRSNNAPLFMEIQRWV